MCRWLWAHALLQQFGAMGSVSFAVMAFVSSDSHFKHAHSIFGTLRALWFNCLLSPALLLCVRAWLCSCTPLLDVLVLRFGVLICCMRSQSVAGFPLVLQARSSFSCCCRKSAWAWALATGWAVTSTRCVSLLPVCLFRRLVASCHLHDKLCCSGHSRLTRCFDWVECRTVSTSSFTWSRASTLWYVSIH